jgi:hypothetical protein
MPVTYTSTTLGGRRQALPARGRFTQRVAPAAPARRRAKPVAPPFLLYHFRNRITRKPDWVIVHAAGNPAGAATAVRIRNWYEKWHTRIQQLAPLPDGWNGYGAAAPTEPALRTARALLVALSDADCEPTRVAPSAVGGIGITRRAGSRKVYVECYNNANVCALFSDGESDPRVEDLQPTRPAFQGLVRRMQDYLDGRTPARDAPR